MQMLLGSPTTEYFNRIRIPHIHHQGVDVQAIQVYDATTEKTDGIYRPN
jgi:hypothetical protein